MVVRREVACVSETQSHYALGVEALLAFAAALLTLRLAGRLASRWRERREPQLLAWSAGLAAYSLGAAAIAWGAAAGWNEGVFRAYYLCGGLLTAALLGTGSLLGVGVRVAGPIALVYIGLAAGVALGVPLDGTIAGTAIPEAQEHLSLFPARVLAIAGNAAGSLALIGGRASRACAVARSATRCCSPASPWRPRGARSRGSARRRPPSS